MINVFTNCLGTDKSGLDTSVTDDFSGECTQQSLTLVGGLAELGNLLSVTHHVEFGCAGGGAGSDNWCLGDCGDVNSGEGGGTWCCEFNMMERKQHDMCCESNDKFQNENNSNNHCSPFISCIMHAETEEWSS